MAEAHKVEKKIKAGQKASEYINSQGHAVLVMAQTITFCYCLSLESKQTNLKKRQEGE